MRGRLGAVIARVVLSTRSYYGKEVSPTDILIRRTVTSPHAAALIQAVAKVAGGK